MSEEPIEYQTVLELCQAEHRRVVLTVLMNKDRALTLNDLTKTLVNYTDQKPVSEVANDERTQIRTALHHVHLPKVADAGLITYDTDEKRIEPTERLHRIQPQLSALLMPDSELEDLLEL